MSLSLDADASNPLAPAEPDGLPMPRRLWSVVAIWLALGMAVLDGAIANVALPTIGHELGADAASSIWIVNAYQLAITMALLPLASLGDKIGYRRVYVTGLAAFTLGSLGCALSHTLAQLITARVFQGLGAAALMSISSALIRHTYPARMLGRAIGWNAVVISVAAAVGPTVASAILAAATWQWLFAINVPVGVVAVLISRWALPHTKGSGAKLDFAAAGLTALTFGGVVLGAEELARDGGPRAALVLALGLLAGVLLVRRESRLSAPMVPLDLLRIRILRLSILTSIVAFAAQMLAFVALPFYFEQVLGRSAVQTGLLITPWPIAVGLTAPIAGRLADRYPAGALGGIGLGVFALGLVLLALVPAGATDLDIVWRMVICGMGFGFFQSPNNRTIVSAAPRHRSGAAGGLLATARLLGQTTGAVAMAVMFHLAAPHPTAIALACAGGVAALAAVLSLLRLHGAEPAPAR